MEKGEAQIMVNKPYIINVCGVMNLLLSIIFRNSDPAPYIM